MFNNKKLWVIIGVLCIVVVATLILARVDSNSESENISSSDSMTEQEANQLVREIYVKIAALEKKEDKNDEEDRLCNTIVNFGVNENHVVIVRILNDSKEMIGLFDKYILGGIYDTNDVVFERWVQKNTAEYLESDESDAPSLPDNSEPLGAQAESSDQKDVEIIQLRNEEKLVAVILDSQDKNNGEVVIDSTIRYYFNKFCNDYVIWYMPNIDDGEFEYTGAAIFYLFSAWNEYDRYPEKLSQESVEASLHVLFSNELHPLQEIKHMTYRKYARIGSDGYYRLYPESGFGPMMVYDLSDLSMTKDSDGFLISAAMTQYYIDTTGYYEPGENELILMDEAERLGLSWETTMMYLLETEKLDMFEPMREMVVDVYIDGSREAHILMFNDGEGTPRLD
jgi:hypothetical protein